jgi:small subunit ribosomal protein S9
VSDEELDQNADAEAAEAEATGQEAAAEEAPAVDEETVVEEIEVEVPAGETVEVEVSADEDVEVEVSADEDVDVEVTESEEPASGGSDLPPGADLEPISVEPEAELSTEQRARLEAEEEERAEREAADAEEGDEDVPPPPPAPAKIAKDARFIATGKRKRSVARVIVLAGEGKITVNDREIDEYFPRPRHRTIVNSPLVATGYESNIDLRIRVHGGGISGQAGAVRHGIARALTEVDPELRSELKRRGFLTRDARAKERRKAGLKKARKRPQFSKR